MTPPRRSGGAPQRASRSSDRIEAPLIILLVWLFFEHGRPPITFGLPLLISVSSVVLWLQRGEKQLGENSHWWFIMLAGMVLMVPFAINGFSAWGSTRILLILFLTICLPLQSLLRRVPDVRAWIYTFLAITTYVGVWATMNGGYGPSGADGGQDENYVAALVTMGVPFAYFLMVSDTRVIVRLLLVGSVVSSVGAIALAQNASRGGFLALCAVGAYIVFRSPRKTLALGMLGVASIAMVLIAGQAFWDEIGSSTDFESGTGDLRIQAWTAGLRMWMANPILGVGPGNFRWQLGNFESAEQVLELGRSMGGSMVAHSMWVELISELGIVGVVCTLALVWGAWKNVEQVQDRAGQLMKTNPNVPEFNELRSFALAVQGSILGVAVSGVFLSLLYYSHMWLLIVLGNALPYVLANLERTTGVGPVSSQGPKMVRGTARRHTAGYARRHP